MAHIDDELLVIDRVGNQTHPPHGGWLVWNPIGENRLRTECGPINVPYRFSGGLTRREVFLTLDDVPLIRRQATGCPTCEQLLQVGCGSAELAATFAEAINQLTIDIVRGEDADWLTAMTPLFRLLPRGVYLVSLDEYFPTDGQGRFFWNQFQSLESFPALSACIDLSDRPCFLAPTQPTNKFQRSSFTQAQRDYRTKPGLALKLDCKVSALLDGHHRALYAALNRERVSCLTLSREYW